MDVVPDVVVHQRGVQRFEVCVVHILKDEAWGLGLGVTDHIKQLYDIGASTEVLQDFDFSLDLQQQIQAISRARLWKVQQGAGVNGSPLPSSSSLASGF